MKPIDFVVKSVAFLLQPLEVFLVIHSSERYDVGHGVEDFLGERFSWRFHC